MRILLVHERFAPDYRGGGEYLVLETARGLQAAGHHVRVLTTGNPGALEFEGISTARLAINPYLMIARSRTVARFARDMDADLIQTFSYHAARPAYFACKGLEIPGFLTVLGLFGREWRNMRPLGIGSLYQRYEQHITTLGFDRTIFLSDYSRDLGISMGVDPSISRVLNPGVDVRAYAPAKEKDNVALFVGKFEARKGIDAVLELARQAPEMRIRMIGWGPGDKRLRSSAPGNLEIIEFQRGNALFEAFASAKLFLFPSHAETFGLVLVEAMAAGCAIVSSIPLPYAGVTVPPGDTAGFIAAARELWSQPDTMREMGRENTRNAEFYNWRRATDELLQIYREVLGQKDG